VQLKDMPKQLQQAYLEVAPHPQNLQSFFDKGIQRMREKTGTPPRDKAAYATSRLMIWLGVRRRQNWL
jgi:hypothetical protein